MRNGNLHEGLGATWLLSSQLVPFGMKSGKLRFSKFNAILDYSCKDFASFKNNLFNESYEFNVILNLEYLKLWKEISENMSMTRTIQHTLYTVGSFSSQN